MSLVRPIHQPTQPTCPVSTPRPSLRQFPSTARQTPAAKVKMSPGSPWSPSSESRHALALRGGDPGGARRLRGSDKRWVPPTSLVQGRAGAEISRGSPRGCRSRGLSGYGAQPYMDSRFHTPDHIHGAGVASVLSKYTVKPVGAWVVVKVAVVGDVRTTRPSIPKRVVAYPVVGSVTVAGKVGIGPTAFQLSPKNETYSTPQCTMR